MPQRKIILRKPTKLPTPPPAPVPVPHEIAFRFFGGMADGAELNYYEAGRYRYAAARMIYILEDFRQTGKTAERITKHVHADFRVGPPEHGSFLDIVKMYVAPIIGDQFLKIPFQHVMTWALGKILPKSTGGDRVAQIADKQADAMVQFAVAFRDREATEQLRIREQSDRLRDMASIFREMREDDKEKDKLIRELVKTIRDQKDGPARLVHEDGSAAFVADELESELNRERDLEQYLPELDRISPEAEEKLVGKVRSIIPDVAKPLDRSASGLQIITDESREPRISLNKKRVREITTTNEDKEDQQVTGNISKFDKVSGYGRIEHEGVRKGIPFYMLTDDREQHKNSVLEAMKFPIATVLARATRDGIGNVVKYRLVKVLRINS